MATKITTKPSEAPKNQGGQKPQRAFIGLKLAALRSIIDEFDESVKLQEILGKPVCEKIGIMAFNNDLKFLEMPSVKLNPEDKKVLLLEMDALMKRRFSHK